VGVSVSPLFVERLRLVGIVERGERCQFKRKRASECEHGAKKEEAEEKDEIPLAQSIEWRLCDVTRRMLFLPVVPVRTHRDEERIPAIRCFMIMIVVE